MSPQNSDRAFTLIELLVTIGIIAVLASMVIGGLGVARTQGDRAIAISNMRQIGTAVVLYAGDHGGTLPGPLWPGQIPYLDPTRDSRLVRILDPYLTGRDVPESGTVDLFVPPAFERSVGRAAVATSRTFVMNMKVVTEGHELNPWGNAADTSPESPLRLALIPGEAWGFSDADQAHPRVKSASWRANTPKGIIHGQKRLAWFFGGNVQSVEESELN